MLVFQIQRVERREEDIVPVNSKKGKEGRKTFFSKTQKWRVSNNMIREIDTSTARTEKLIVKDC